MTRMQVHPDTKSEAKKAFDWYWEQSETAALEFDVELRLAYARLRRNPHLGVPHLHGTRRLTIRRYPNSVAFREIADGIQVLAIAHAKRRPGYWSKRIKQ